jgi:hypothetical protein
MNCREYADLDVDEEAEDERDRTGPSSSKTAVSEPLDGEALLILMLLGALVRGTVRPVEVMRILLPVPWLGTRNGV